MANKKTLDSSSTLQRCWRMEANESQLHSWGFFDPKLTLMKSNHMFCWLIKKKKEKENVVLVSTVQHCVPYVWILSCRALQTSPGDLYGARNLRYSSLFSFRDVHGLSWFHLEQWYHWEDMCISFLHFFFLDQRHWYCYCSLCVCAISALWHLSNICFYTYSSSAQKSSTQPFSLTVNFSTSSDRKESSMCMNKAPVIKTDCCLSAAHELSPLGTPLVWP